MEQILVRASYPYQIVQRMVRFRSGNGHGLWDRELDLNKNLTVTCPWNRHLEQAATLVICRIKGW